MVKNKYIIFPFLFLAWTIIFAHSVIPHHHHLHEITAQCNHGYSSSDHVLEKAEFHDCEHECSDNACHFHVEILTKGNLDNDFLTNVADSFFRDLNNIVANHNDYYDAFVSNQIPETNYLRGPPSIS